MATRALTDDERIAALMVLLKVTQDPNLEIVGGYVRKSRMGDRAGAHRQLMEYCDWREIPKETDDAP